MDWVGLLDKNVRVSVLVLSLLLSVICIYTLHTNLYIQKAPIVPHYPHPGDTSNFEKYPEQCDTENNNLIAGEDPFKDLFVGFS